MGTEFSHTDVEGIVSKFKSWKTTQEVGEVGA